MPIGDNTTGSGNSYQNKAFENTYYSRLRFRNGNDQINISYKSGLMILEMGTVGDGYKFEAAENVYLSPTKAGMLVGSINALIEYINTEKKIDPNKAFGVNAGMNEKTSFIGFSSDSDKNIYVTIGKFDQAGVITQSSKFQFSKDYNYSLEWNNLEENDIVKVYDNSIDLNMLKNALADFSRNMSGALAYTIADTTRYDLHRINRRIDQVFDKLGIERVSYSRKAPVENSFLANASSRTTSLEEIEDSII